MQMLTRIAVWLALAAALAFILFSGTVQDTSLKFLLISALTGVAIAYLFISVARGSAKQSKLDDVDKVMNIEAEEQDHR